jgi:HK97 family phage major capsid protein/HK97 family phage prohead protease
MTLQRAYSVFVVKALDEETRVLTGIASTPATDRQDDIVEPKGAQFSLPLPLLWQHQHDKPIGHVTQAKITAKGIEVSVQLARTDEPGPLKDRLDEAWQSIKMGLVRGFSIGFRALESTDIEGSWGRRFLKWDWLELSAVTIPANAQATIQTVKSFDKAASGHQVVRLSNRPGASGKTVGTYAKGNPRKEENMNTQDQINTFREELARKSARMAEIMNKSGESGETLDAQDQAEFDELSGTIDTIEGHIKRLEVMEKAQLSAAKRVTVDDSGKNPEKSADQRVVHHKTSIVAVEKKDAPGVAFARYAGIMAAAKGSVSDALMMARDTFPEEKRLHAVLKNHQNRITMPGESFTKAAVDVGTTLDTDYAAPLVYARQMESEFIEWLRPQTIIGQIQGLRRVPFNIRVPRQTSGGSASWVGEAAPKPLTQIALDTVSLKYKKLATIAVISEELARFSQPSAELIIRDTLAGAIIQQMDSDFVNPANAGTTDVKPASITNGVSAIVSSGTDETSVRRDIQAVFAPFITANLTPQNGVWLMSATNALALSLMVNNLGQPAFPGITMTGGTFWGMPVIVSEAVGDIVILANANDIMLADDGQVTIDTSREASLQMDSAPTNPPVATTVFISLWQMNLLGIKAERYIDWVKARAASVQYLSGVAWGNQPT